jgi:hypothetical protein
MRASTPLGQDPSKGKQKENTDLYRCSKRNSERAGNGQLTFDFDGYGHASAELFRALGEDRRIERKPAGIHADVQGEYFSMWANTTPAASLLSFRYAEPRRATRSPECL